MGKKAGSEKRIAEILLSILRRELWGRPQGAEDVEISGSDYPRVMKLADKQAVVGMVARCMAGGEIRAQIPKKYAVNTALSGQSVRLANFHLNTAVAGLTALLHSGGIRRFVVFKGQTIAALYPHPESRAVGDVDFYVAHSEFAAARRLIRKRWDIEFDPHESEQHISFTHDGTQFEMHFLIHKFFSSGRQQVVNKILEQSQPASVTICGKQIPTLDTPTAIAYTFIHLWYHMIELGIGLRQLCDLAVLISRRPTLGEEGARCTARLSEILNQVGLRRAFCAVEMLLSEYLGLSDLPIKPTIGSRTYAHAIMKRVLRYGNMGRYGRKGHRGEAPFYMRLTLERILTYLKFLPLDPREISARIAREMPAKIVLTSRRKHKRRKPTLQF